MLTAPGWARQVADASSTVRSACRPADPSAVWHAVDGASFANSRSTAQRRISPSLQAKQSPSPESVPLGPVHDDGAASQVVR
jgi:hypothetical protein